MDPRTTAALVIVWVAFLAAYAIYEGGWLLEFLMPRLEGQ